MGPPFLIVMLCIQNITLNNPTKCQRKQMIIHILFYDILKIFLTLSDFGTEWMFFWKFI